MSKQIQNPLDFLRNPGSVSVDDHTENLTEKENNKSREEEESKRLEEEEKSKNKRKTREDNIADLKAARDKAQREFEKAQERLKDLEGLAPLKKVAEHLKKKKGKDAIEEEDVDEFIETNRTRKKSLTEFEQKLKEKDQIVKDLEIEKSDEWKTEYVAPIQKAATNIFTTLAQVGDDGRVIGEDLTKNLMSELAQVDDKGNPKTPLEIKQVIRRFQKKFFDETGVEYDAPSIPEISEGIEKYHSKVKSAFEAKKNWSEAQENRKKEKIFEMSKNEKEVLEKEIKGRDYIFNKVINSDDFKGAVEIIGEDLINAAKSEHEYMQGILKQDETAKPRGYEGLINSLAKGKAFDVLLTKFRDAQKKIEELEADLGSSIPHRSRSKHIEDKSGREAKPEEMSDPAAFLRNH
jgi:hypothetical protein